MVSPVEIFCCYARKDQGLLKELIAHLKPLQRQGLITIWADTDIDAGMEWEKEIENHLYTAQIILLLVSSAFMDSEYCYSNEMAKAIARHNQEEARVIPVILRPIMWQNSPFGKIQALPTNGKPVISAFWHSSDDAFFSVAEGISKVVERLLTNQSLPMQKVPLKILASESAREASSINFVSRNREDDHRKVSYQLFFADLLERLKIARPTATNAKKTQPESFWFFGAGKTGYIFIWTFTKNGLKVGLVINIPNDRNATKKAFDALHEQRAAIEKEFSQSLFWDRLEGKESHIFLIRPATIADHPEEMEQTKKWAVETMVKFVDVFKERIKIL